MDNKKWTDADLKSAIRNWSLLDSFEELQDFLLKRRELAASLDSKCNKHIVNACAPNKEFKGTLKTYSGFTQSNRNILQIEVAGVENYIGNTLKVGDEVNIQHWR